MDNRVRHHRVSVAGIDSFREAGRADAPVVLLPHGYPAPPTNFATSCRVLQTAGGCSRRNFQAPATAHSGRCRLQRWRLGHLARGLHWRDESRPVCPLPTRFRSPNRRPFDDPNVWWDIQLLGTHLDEVAALVVGFLPRVHSAWSLARAVAAWTFDLSFGVVVQAR